MDNEFEHPHSEHGEHVPAPAEVAPAPDPATIIEQVRELLFGEQRRATDAALKSLEDRLAALTATVEARVADIERRFNEARTETDHSRDHHVEQIGAAFADLADRIKSLIAKPQS
jgi:hypothetical protein